MARDTYLDFMNAESYEQFQYMPTFQNPKTWAIKVLQAAGTGYNLVLQQDKGEKQPMVRAGCRYMTLREAKAHWGRRRHHRRKQCAAILLQIATLVAMARANGWTKAKFDPTIQKKKPVKVIAARRKTKRAVKKSHRR